LKGVVSTGYLEFGDGPNPICSGAAVVRPIIFDSSGNMIAINAYQVGAGYLSSQLPTTKSGLIPTRWLPSELSYGAVAYDSSGNLFEGLQVTSNGDNIAASTAAQLSTMWTSGGEASFNLGFNGGGNCVTAMSDDTFYNGGLFEVQGGLAEAISSTNLESLVGTGGGNTPVYGNLAVPSGTAALDVLPLRFFQ
jgi:hypothetical protein